MIRNGKQYAVVIFKGMHFAPCTGCPFYHKEPLLSAADCTAKSEGFPTCINEADKRGLKNRYALTFREVNKHE